MKKSLLILPLAAALALSSCSKDETLDEGAVADGNGRFLAVSIIPNNNGGGTRAGEGTDGVTGSTTDPGYEQSGAKFEDGTTTENDVKSVRLYFFNASGDAVSVKKGSSANYYDIPLDTIKKYEVVKGDGGFGGPVHAETVEKTINAVVIVEAGEKLPAQIVTVVNPDTGFLTSKGANLTTLNDFADDYAARVNEKGMAFTMTTSVYADGNTVVNMTTVTPDKYAKKRVDAINNPVKIYVERNVAKVRVSVNEDLNKANINGVGEKSVTPLRFPVMRKISSGDIPYKLYDSTPNPDGTKKDSVAVYVHFYGWDVTATLSYGYFLKHINANAWDNSKLGGPQWNAPQYHRSYWADVCDGGSKGDLNPSKYFSYADKNHFKSTLFDGTEHVYCNENAERLTTTPATKIIIKAEICKADGTPVTITEFAGNRFIDDANFTGLKNRYMVMYKANRAQMYWKAVKEGDKTTYKEIEISDLDFMTATAANGLNEDKSGTYYVYPCLSAAAKNYTWYSKIPQSADDTSTTAEVKDVNDELKKLSRGKIWNAGKAYYFDDIKHLGTSVGVVRNHIYDIALKKIYGLGTPVYNPEEVIIPEKPQAEDTYVAAQINILSWRVVNSEVELNWND